LSIPDIDPGTPEAEFAEFVATIRRAFGAVATEAPGTDGGLVWRWSRRGLWSITAGAVLHPDPVLSGPAGEWRIARADRAGATYALLVLSGADALPPEVEIPRTGRPSPSPATYAGGVRIPDAAAPAVRPPAPLPADPERGGFRPAAGRPAYREPGANTGAAPGASFGSRNVHRGERVLGEDLPLAGMGPGAAYAPSVIRDDRTQVRPDCGPAAPVTPSDLPARGAGIPASMDDTGRTASGSFPLYETTTTAWPAAPASSAPASPWSSPPAAAEDRPAYSPPADTGGGTSSAPAGCE
jgi:hypothetical protein